MPISSFPSPPNFFPTYLIPAAPFRRRKASADSVTSNETSASSEPTSAAVTPEFLEGQISYLRCSRCLNDLCLASQIISKGFTGRHGRAYLVSPSTSANDAAISVRNSSNLPNLPNTHVHKAVPRQLVTGQHTVSDISCAACGSVLGWKYVAAEEESQRYKVGKFILETKRVCRSSFWENDFDKSADGDNRSAAATVDEIEFDSQDEDECEDLFAGVWSPQLAQKRRKSRNFTRGLN